MGPNYLNLVMWYTQDQIRLYYSPLSEISMYFIPLYWIGFIYSVSLSNVTIIDLWVLWIWNCLHFTLFWSVSLNLSNSRILFILLRLLLHDLFAKQIAAVCNKVKVYVLVLSKAFKRMWRQILSMAEEQNFSHILYRNVQFS